jgi:hypothetical protein
VTYLYFPSIPRYVPEFPKLLCRMRPKTAHGRKQWNSSSKSESFESIQGRDIVLIYFRFELDYILAALPKPYVVAMDGITSEYEYTSLSYYSNLNLPTKWVEVSGFPLMPHSGLPQRIPSLLCQRLRLVISRTLEPATFCRKWMVR